MKSESDVTLAKLKKRLFKQMGVAIDDFKLIEEGDHIMVAISGGKDSWAMLLLLEEIRKKAPISFELTAVHLDQGEPYSPHKKIEAALKETGLRYLVVHEQLYEIVEEKLKPGQTRCSLCSRLRRGVLYNVAVKLQCNKIALGHHRDDLIETLLMNQFFSGSTATMPAYLQSNDQRNVVIRPMCYVSEKDLRLFCDLSGITYLACQACDLAMNQRGMVKKLLRTLEKDIPEVRNSLLKSLQNIKTSHMLDRKLFHFSEEDTELTEPPLF